MLVFQTNPARVNQAVAYLAAELGRVPYDDALWILLTADALHLSDYGRPVTGDQWTAAPFGPEPRFLTRLVNAEPAAVNRIPPRGEDDGFLPTWAAGDGYLYRDDYRHHPIADPARSFNRLSVSDREALSAAVSVITGTGDPSDGATHALGRVHDAWRTGMGGPIDYATLLPADATEDQLDDLDANSRRIAM